MFGQFSGASPTADELSRAADALREVVEYAAHARVYLSIEAGSRVECYELDAMTKAAALKRRVEHPTFAYMNDTFHVNTEQRDPIAAYLAHAGDITPIHISENDREIPGREHLSSGPRVRL